MTSVGHHVFIRAGKLSDSVMELRKQSGAFLTTFLATHNQSTDEGAAVALQTSPSLAASGYEEWLIRL